MELWGVSMAKSLISDEKKCFKCGTTYGIHKHHIFGGPNRNNSEKYGCWVYLCGRHHNLSDEGIHFDFEFNLITKQFCQQKFECKYNHQDFMKIFGKNYL